MTIEDAITQLLSHSVFIRNRDIRRLTGHSRQAICTVLNRLVNAGELTKTGHGRSLEYRRAGRKFPLGHSQDSPYPARP